MDQPSGNPAPWGPPTPRGEPGTSRATARLPVIAPADPTDATSVLFRDHTAVIDMVPSETLVDDSLDGSDSDGDEGIEIVQNVTPASRPTPGHAVRTLGRKSMMVVGPLGPLLLLVIGFYFLFSGEDSVKPPKASGPPIGVIPRRIEPAQPLPAPSGPVNNDDPYERALAAANAQFASTGGAARITAVVPVGPGTFQLLVAVTVNGIDVCQSWEADARSAAVPVTLRELGQQVAC